MANDLKVKEKDHSPNDSDADGPLILDTLDVVPSTESAITTDATANAQLDLNSNVSGAITNPLQGIPYDKLLARAANFANSHGLQDYLALIQRGALVAQSPRYWTEIPDLLPDEREALDYEHHHKWAMSPALMATIFVCGLGAGVQGWDQTGASGANLTMGVILGIPNGQDPTKSDYSPDW